MPTRAQAAGGRSSPTASGRPRGAPDAVRAAPSGQPPPGRARATPRVIGTMRRRSRAAFRVYDEDEFFAAPVEGWLCEASAPAARPRSRFLAGRALLAGAIFAGGSAIALERLPSSGGSRTGAMFGADGSRTRYLAARSLSVPIRARFTGSTPRGSSSSLPPRAPRARTGAGARGHLRIPRTRGGAVRARMAARARTLTTPVGSEDAPVRAAAPVPAPAPISARAPVPGGEGRALVVRRATREGAPGAGTAAEGRPVVSASSGADRRERSEFGFER